MSKEKQIDVLVAGHICFDIIPKFSKTEYRSLDKIFVPGNLVNIGEPALSTGGPVTNTGFAISKLGAKVDFMAKVGDDIFGNAVIKMMEKETGAASKGIKKEKGVFSPYTVCVALPNIDRVFLHHPGTNDTFGYKDIDFDIVKNAKIFHLGYPPLMRKLYQNDGIELVRILKKAKSLNLTTSVDMSLPDPESESGRADWDAILRNILPHVDLFLPSIEETMFMLMPEKHKQLKSSLRSEDDIVDHISVTVFTKLSDILLEYGAKIATLKCAHRGFYVRTAGKAVLDKIGPNKPENLDSWTNRELWAPSYRITSIASALGSGDSAVAGFLVAFLKSTSAEEAIRYANAVGAQNLSTYDATSGIGNWEETKKMVNNEEAVFNELKITTPGWRRAKDMKTWTGPNDRK